MVIMKPTMKVKTAITIAGLALSGVIGALVGTPWLLIPSIIIGTTLGWVWDL